MEFREDLADGERDGPTFYNYFYKQNQAISNGSIPGVPLSMDTLGIINGIIDEGKPTFLYIPEPS